MLCHFYPLHLLLFFSCLLHLYATHNIPFYSFPPHSLFRDFIYISTNETVGFLFLTLNSESSYLRSLLGSSYKLVITYKTFFTALITGIWNSRMSVTKELSAYSYYIHSSFYRNTALHYQSHSFREIWLIPAPELCLHYVDFPFTSVFHVCPFLCLCFHFCISINLCLSSFLTA